MEKINVGRVVVGGLVAGFVINAGEFLVNGVLFAETIQDVTERLGLPAMTDVAMAGLVAGGFVLGIVLVWLYAAVRPRFGPGPKAALIVGCAVWLLAWAWPAFVDHATGMYGAHLMLLGWTVSLVEVLAAAYVGGWLYREG